MSSIIVKEEISNICRICLNDDPEYRHTIFDELPKDVIDKKINRIHDFLMSFTDIKIKENDGLPYYICGECLELTQSAFNLYKLCNESQKHFNEISEIPTGTNVNAKEMDVENELSFDSDMYSETNFISIYKTEITDETISFEPSYKIELPQLPENPGDLNISITVGDETESTPNKKISNLETNPNITRQFDYIGTYIEKTRNGKLLYECTKCNQLINCGPNDFKRHYDLHLEPFYRCNNCNSEFRRQYSYKLHLALCQNKPLTTTSKKKSAKYIEFGSTRKPGELETNPQVKRFVDLKGKYTVKILDDKKRFACNDCEKSFIEFHHFKRHYDMHLDPFYVCTQCQKTFSCQRQFKIHLETHSDERFMCETCGKIYKSKQGLQEHCNIHNNIKYKCDLCEKSFFRRGELLLHKKYHGDARPYICLYCGSAFKTNSNLLVHEKIHTGEKRHQCDQCDKAFIGSNCLKKHKLTHMDNPPLIHECDQCDKSFKTKGNLRQHQQSHMEKRYQCDVCLKKFTQAHSLRSHKKICSGPAK